MNTPVLVPRISEKAIGLAEKGVYVFEVPTSTNKIEVAKAVAAAFKVEVIAVNMMVVKGKQSSRRYGRNAGRRNDVKKAMVTLKSGQKIALFEEGSK